MHKYGYKKGIIFGLVLYAIGTLLFVQAASQREYFFFLIALFVIASGATFLEAVANPYITILGDKDTSTQRLNFAQSFNGVGSFIAPIIGGQFILSGIERTSAELKRMDSTQLNAYLQSEANSVKIPYLVIAGAVFLLIILFLFTHIPEVKEDDSAVSNHSPGADFSIRVLKHRHLSMAIIAQFFYVGAQVGVGFSASPALISSFGFPGSISFLTDTGLSGLPCTNCFALLSAITVFTPFKLPLLFAVLLSFTSVFMILIFKCFL